jgi:ABC-2 type transport system ATP-binding protein
MSPGMASAAIAPPAPADVVEVEHLVKRYGDRMAVDDVSFRIAPGEIFGLLGPNGAGKTTAIECLIGLRPCDGGRVRIAGLDPQRDARQVRERIGVQLQATALHDAIGVREALVLFASFYQRHDDIDGLLARFGLLDKARARCATLSGGQRQRLALALALINRPQLVVLDEPTANLDPQARLEVHAIIRDLRAAGRAVLITTHHIEEAERLCDRVAIIDHGRILRDATPRDLVAAIPARAVLSVVSERPLAADRLRALPGVLAAQAEDCRASLTTADRQGTILALVQMLGEHGNGLCDLHLERPSLEDAFIALTGRELRD